MDRRLGCSPDRRARRTRQCDRWNALVRLRRQRCDPEAPLRGRLRSAFGLELGATAPTATHGVGFGSGKPDWSANGIYSADIGSLHTDFNVVATRLGGRSPDASSLQTLGAFALSGPLSDRWTLEGEFSGTRQHGASATSQVLGALSYAVRRDLVIDVGAAHGLNRASPTWQAFAGLTVIVGRLD